MNLADDDGSGTISKNEFMFLMLISEENYASVVESKQVFDKYNSNKEDRLLDRSELKVCLQELNVDI